MKAMDKVLEQYPELDIPKRLRNAPTELMKEIGNAKGYKYPHDFPGGFVPERYLPDEIKDLIVYHPTDRALDAQIKERLQNYRAQIKSKGG